MGPRWDFVVGFNCNLDGGLSTKLIRASLGDALNLGRSSILVANGDSGDFSVDVVFLVGVLVVDNVCLQEET